jgi:Holliday junction resolvase RusA-like endonuclease
MIVYIEPMACPRPRVTRLKRVYYPVRYKNWIKDMRGRLTDMTVPEGALHVELTFIVKRPQRLRKGERIIHSKRPDLDNMVKAVLDALPIPDDAVVCSITAKKFYAAFGEDPQIDILISSAENKKSLG